MLTETMEIRQLSELYDSPLNVLNEITDDAYTQLLEELRKGQHTTLLIMPDGEVIGGKHRRKGMIELGMEKARVITLTHNHDPERGYSAVLDGEPVIDPITKEPRYYQSLDELKLDYIMSHNNEASSPDLAKLDEYRKMYTGLDWDSYMIAGTKPQRVSTALKEFMIPQTPLNTPEEEDPPTPVKKSRSVSCPSCGHEFSIE